MTFNTIILNYYILIFSTFEGYSLARKTGLEVVAIFKQISKEILKMTYKIVIILLLSSIHLYSQTLCRTDIMNNEEVISADRIERFIKYDFSQLWLKTENEFVYGIIGDEHQRILVKILTVLKNSKNPKEYLITGKSSVKENVCRFSGKITVIKIQESKRTIFGVDNEFRERLKTQGILIAQYEFFENKGETHSGVFHGLVKTKWYLDKKNKIRYDDTNIEADGYFNNAFVGTWKMYKSNVLKKCNWADYRVPNSNCDFDIGAGDFNVSEKYWKNGWLDIALKNKVTNQNIENTKSSGNKKWWL